MISSMKPDLNMFSYVWRFLKMTLSGTAIARTKFLIKSHFLVDIHNICVYIIIIDDGVKKVSKNAQFIEKFLHLNIYYNRQANQPVVARIKA